MGPVARGSSESLLRTLPEVVLLFQGAFAQAGTFLLVNPRLRGCHGDSSPPPALPRCLTTGEELLQAWSTAIPR